MEKQTILDKLENFNEQLNLTHYWIILLKYKRIILFLPLFFGLLGYLIALNIKPIFQSKATIVIEKQEKKIVDIEEVYASQGGARFGSSVNHINNQIEILRSDEILNGLLSDEQIAKKINKISRNGKIKYFSIFNNSIISDYILFKTFNKKNKYRYVWD